MHESNWFLDQVLCNSNNGDERERERLSSFVCQLYRTCIGRLI